MSVIKGLNIYQSSSKERTSRIWISYVDLKSAMFVMNVMNKEL